MQLQGIFLLALVACVAGGEGNIATLDIDGEPIEVTKEDMMELTSLTVV